MHTHAYTQIHLSIPWMREKIMSFYLCPYAEMGKIRLQEKVKQSVLKTTVSQCSKQPRGLAVLQNKCLLLVNKPYITELGLIIGIV